MIKIFTDTRGQLLIEALIALALATILLPALFAGFFASKQGKAQKSPPNDKSFVPRSPVTYHRRCVTITFTGM